MSTDTKTSPLSAFRRVDFNWATRLQDVWTDPIFDVPEIHRGVRQRFIDQVGSMAASSAKRPQGWFIVGSGGVGKTHLLSSLRGEAAQLGAAFVLVDMTDVRNFFEIVLQGYLDSLQSVYLDGKFQYQILIHRFIKRLSSEQRAAAIVQQLTVRKSTSIAKDVADIVRAMSKIDRQNALRFQDVIKSLICLNSDDYDISNIGYSWLQLAAGAAVGRRNR